MLPELSHLETEQRNSATSEIDRLSTLEMLALLNREDAAVLNAVEAAVPAIATVLDGVVERVRTGGSLFYIGAGTSGRLGVLDAAECPPTFGVASTVVRGIIAGGEAALARATEASEDRADAGAADLMAAGFTANDALVGIAASGRTPYVIGAIERARSMGALTAALVCARSSALAGAAELAIEIPVGPEAITGSTRMKAGTATKLVLNMLSTGLMIRLGYTYGNLMVNVQPRNEKLRDRARRIVAQAAGIDRGAADSYFEAAGGDVKRAIVMARLGVSNDEAARRLGEANGVLSAVLPR
ncbi:MAG: N-acetylmuramic acid 6-phosphate etherase [Acidobacteria bacterium]|nr:N-acetylmuramic acid 6-phosphate etherase [Acidobacteriota bacterium]